MRISITSKFERSFKKLPREIQLLAVEQEKKFRKNIFSSSLHTHKLSGKLSGYYSFSIDFGHRILFEMLSSNHVLFVNIGDHSIYR